MGSLVLIQMYIFPKKQEYEGIMVGLNL